MRHGLTVAVIIPALNEEQSIGKVVSAIPDWVDDVIVADNGSTDRTADVARDHGARVIREPRRGYGSACLAGLGVLRDPDVVVFLDADFSDYPEEMSGLVDPIVRGEADLVVGSRVRGEREAGALTPQARFGNWLACSLIRLLWRTVYTDLGPFRAIRCSALRRLGMRDLGYGWTVEMQIKAAQARVPSMEVPVRYRCRIGESKISGTVKGVAGAGTKILATIARLALLPARRRGRARSERLIVFTRYPEAGRTKTRLIPALGAEGAAALHRRMADLVLDRAAALRRERPLDVAVRYVGGNARLMKHWLGPDTRLVHQGPGDLGARMSRAFRQAFLQGAERAIIVGTDCPALSANHMARAFEALHTHDLVLGPADDGGYYLIGLRHPVPRLFADIPWGTGDVLERTLGRAAELGVSVAQLDGLRDVDRPDDLTVWEEETRRSPPVGGRVSVVIPALDEAEMIPATLASVTGVPDVEVIVADGGSGDATRTIAERFGATVLSGPPARAQQINAAAAVATGDVLLFLHADTLLPPGFERHVRRAMAHPDAVGGAFQFRLDATGWGLRVIERLTDWRSRRFQMPYGDQAIFVAADRFAAMGGFPIMPIMEDFELVRRLRRQGRVVIAQAPAVTSARRWVTLGTWRTSLINQITIGLYYLGVPISKVARYYRSRLPRRTFRRSGQPEHEGATTQ